MIIPYIFLYKKKKDNKHCLVNFRVDNGKKTTTKKQFLRVITKRKLQNFNQKKMLAPESKHSPAQSGAERNSCDIRLNMFSKCNKMCFSRKYETEFKKSDTFQVTFSVKQMQYKLK